ncbi:TipJ family phage tail tip protein [Oceanimonas smirnovii]|uniref:TipJ family phage tail tip protein n=1 Tax=Oceanimonas smirnovii TaxID=264574 RepID=UPI003FD203F5
MGGGGKGGGGSARTPREQADNLKSRQRAQIVDVLCEGPILGPVNGLNSALLDDTPVENENGSINVPGLDITWRNGSQVQDVMPIAAVENEVSVGIEVKRLTPVVRSITNENVDRIRVTVGVPALVKTDPEKGDRVRTSVAYRIERGIAGVWSVVHEDEIKDGKTKVPYTRSYDVARPGQSGNWSVRVTRITPDSTSDLLQNKTVFYSYTEVVDAQLTYPNTAVVGLRFDSENFQNIPRRNYHIRGRIIRVPSNYNLETRAYTGIWDGTFKLGWTNNPAWIFYDLCTDERVGVGRQLLGFEPDKWALYQIARYCDELVDDGFGGREPRMTCNLYLTSQRQAYDVLYDLASVFRGMPVWDGLTMSVSQDRPQDSVWQYNNSNVVDGRFEYQSSARKARHTAVQVEYVDPDSGWEKNTEYVQDDELVARYGLNVLKVQAFGCTSRGQAHRTGRWILVTEKYERQSVSFATGAEGLIALPGDVIDTVDNDYAGARLSGRVKSVDANVVVLDAPVALPDGMNYIHYLDAQSRVQRVRIMSPASGETDTLVLQSDPVGIQPWDTFNLATAQLAPRKWRVMSMSENREQGTWQYSCVQHVPEKHAIIEEGIKFEPGPTTINGGSLPPIEHINVDLLGEQDPPKARLTWTTPRVVAGILFEVKIFFAERLLERQIVADTAYTAVTAEQGQYRAEIRAITENGQKGPETSTSFTVAPPLAATSLHFTPSEFSVTVRPVISGPVPLNTTYDWYLGTTEAAVREQGQYLGRGFTWNQAGLMPDTAYWFGAVAVNGLGRSAITVGATRTTKDTSNIFALLDGQIGAEQLREELRTPIAQIPGINTELESIKATEIPSLQASLDQLDSRQTMAESLLNDAQQALGQSSIDITLMHDRLSQMVERYRGDLATFRDAVFSVNPETGQIEMDAVNALRTETEQSITQLNLLIDAMTGDITSKADKATVTAQGQSLTLVEQRLSAAESAITSQVSRAEFTAEQEKVTTLTQSLDAVTGTLSQKADSTTVTAQGQKLASAEQQLSAVTDELAAQAQELVGVNAELDGVGADLVSLSQAVATDKEATATRLNAVDAELGGNSGRLTLLEEAVASEGGITAGRFDEITAQFELVGQDADAAAEAAVANALANDERDRERKYSEAQIRRDQQIAVDAQQATAKDVVEIKAQYGEQQASIAELRETVASETIARAEQISKTEAQLRAEDAEIAGSVESLSRVVSDLEGTTAESIEQVNARFERVSESTDAAAGAAIDGALANDEEVRGRLKSVGQVSREQKSTATAQEATARDLLLLRSEFSTEQQTTSAQISQLAETFATADTAMAQRVDTVQAEVGDNAAALQQEQTARADADSALGQRIDTVQAKANGNAAALQQEQTARADADSALAQQIDTVQGSVNNVSASVQTVSRAQANTAGELSALWAAKAQVGGASAGFGLEVTQTSDGKTLSSFIVDAAIFAVLNKVAGAGSVIHPFVIKDNQVYINKVVIDTADIRNLIADYINAQSIIAPSIKSSVNDPLFELTREGKLITKDVDAEGKIKATSGEFDNVVINENCEVKGQIYAKNLKDEILQFKFIQFPEKDHGEGVGTTHQWFKMFTLDTSDSGVIAYEQGRQLRVSCGLPADGIVDYRATAPAGDSAVIWVRTGDAMPHKWNADDKVWVEQSASKTRAEAAFLRYQEWAYYRTDKLMELSGLQLRGSNVTAELRVKLIHAHGAETVFFHKRYSFGGDGAGIDFGLGGDGIEPVDIIKVLPQSAVKMVVEFKRTKSNGINRLFFESGDPGTIFKLYRNDKGMNIIQHYS